MGAGARFAQGGRTPQGGGSAEKYLALLSGLGHSYPDGLCLFYGKLVAPHQEVDFLLVLFEQILKQELEEMCREGVKIQFIGDLSQLPPSLCAEMHRSMEATAHNQAIHFNVAINYGSRHEIVSVCRQIATKVKSAHMDPQLIDEQLIRQHLYTGEQQDPDLLIRTSGEMRLSNFLLWQLAYTEMYFTPTLWPDFNHQELHRALLEFQRRQRRYGKVC
jgi:undecaprenyl diphosphate synthase